MYEILHSYCHVGKGLLLPLSWMVADAMVPNRHRGICNPLCWQSSNLDQVSIFCIYLMLFLSIKTPLMILKDDI